MFNPQRKSKVADIFMQEKIFKIHLEKKNKIEQSLNLRSQRYDEQEEQQMYLARIEKSKRQVQQRLSQNIRKQNHRLMEKLLETDAKPQSNPEMKNQKKHHNSYFNSKRESKRIHEDNFTLVLRMDSKSPGVPSLRQLKKQYKANRKYARNCRKLPSIIKHEEVFKQKLSKPDLATLYKSSTSQERK